MSSPDVMVLMGPTGIGKSACAMAMAQRMPCEIVSVDATSIYRGLDCGSAKPSHADQVQVAHHLIDCCDASESFSVADFSKRLQTCVEEILGRHKVPLLVGGTMMYCHAILRGLAPLPTTEPSVRAHFQQRITNQGVALLWQELSRIDPVAASRIAPQDSQRISRALEVYAQTGKTLTYWLNQAHVEVLPGLDIAWVALVPTDRQALYAQINQRVLAMLAMGWVEEVRDLLAIWGEDAPALRSIGYRQILAYLKDELSYDAMVCDTQTASRRLAKRQLTWLKQWPNLWCVDVAVGDDLSLHACKIYDRFFA